MRNTKINKNLRSSSLIHFVLNYKKKIFEVTIAQYSQLCHDRKQVDVKKANKQMFLVTFFSIVEI